MPTVKEEDYYVPRAEYEKRHADLRVWISSIEGDIKNLRTVIDASERNQEIKEHTQNIAIDKASDVLNEKLEAMNQFRRQIDSERALYVTRDQLDLTVKAVNIGLEGVRQQIQPMRTLQDFNKGRDATVYSFIAIGVAVIAAAASILAIIFH